MSPSELIELIKALKDAGVANFKQGDLELSFNPLPKIQLEKIARELKPSSLEIPPGIPETQPPHIVQEMQNLFKTSDADLLEQLFPLPVEEAN